jgi:DNA-binding beta-propeller fold protein YncE
LTSRTGGKKGGPTMAIFRTLPGLLAALGLLCVTASAAALPQYRIEQTVKLPGDGGWDYLTFDAVGQRLFLARSTRVEVIDTRQLVHVGEIAATPGVHGIALAQDLGRGYISAGASSTIVVFDLKTLERVKDIKSTGENPDSIVYDPATQRVFAFNGRSRSATVIDAVSNEVVGTIALDAKPEEARADGTGKVFVNLEDKNSVAVIDARTLRIVSVIALTGCDSPSGLALNVAAQRLFAVCDNHVMVAVDVTTGRLLGSAPIGGSADGAGYDAGARLAFASCGEGVLSVVASGSDGAPQLVQTVPTQRGARTMALDEQHHRVFLVTADYGATAAPTAEHPHPRPTILPGTFRLLVIAPHAQKQTNNSEGNGT